MSRAITIQNEDEYNKRILKNIPSEIVGAYLAISGFLAANADTPLWLYWLFFIMLLILCPLWLRFGQNVRKTWQLVLSTIAFPIWVMTLPGPFDIVPYASTIGGALVIVWSFVVAPMISKNMPKQAGA